MRSILNIIPSNECSMLECKELYNEDSMLEAKNYTIIDHVCSILYITIQFNIGSHCTCISTQGYSYSRAFNLI